MNNRTLLITALFVAPYINMAGGVTLNVGGASLDALTTCTSDHKLNIYDGTNTYCIPATTDTLMNTLHVVYNGTTYSLCDGACGGGTWVMPEEPEAPIVLPSNCDWTQTDSGAYLLSDGNQYFDTGVAINSRNNIEVTVKVTNGKSARIFGTVGSNNCYFDMTMNNAGNLAVRMGNTGKSYTLNDSEKTTKNVYKTENGSNNKKLYSVNGRDLTGGGRQVNSCTGSQTMMVLNNDYVTITQGQNGGIKLYNIKVWNTSGTLLHEYQPVPQGTNICGYTALTNAMWDTVTKKLYYPGGTGQMGYGTDTQ